MTEVAHPAPRGMSRLDRLLPMLDVDPNNLALLSDAADTALAERRPDITAQLLDRYAAITPLPDKETNLAGLAALQLNRFDEAAGRFERLVGAGVGGGGVRFNLAWALAMSKQLDRALALLDEEVAQALPQAAMLKIQILHEQGEMDAAAELAPTYVRLHADHPGLMAALSVLAIDLGDLEQAERCAAAAAGHPDALATQGALALDRARPAEALAIFDRALELDPHVPRAWVGRGLARLAGGDAAQAAADLDRGAEMFGEHLGSWIAAGWAHFIRNDLAASRARFERALDIDPTFAEAQGSLAVIEIIEGDVAAGRERAEKAFRLDRESFSAALARVLLASAGGDQAAARRMFELALNAPVDGSGRTIAAAAARLGMRSRM